MKLAHPIFLIAMALCVACAGSDDTNDPLTPEPPSEPEPPPFDTLRIVLDMPDEGASAVVLSFFAQSPANAFSLPENSDGEFHMRTIRSAAMIAVFGDLEPGTLLTFEIPRGTPVSDYSVGLYDAAREDGSIIETLDDYEAHVSH